MGNALLEQVSQLQASEQLALAESILSNLDAPDATIDALWLDEAHVRLEAWKIGQVQAVPLATVMAKYARS